MHIMFVTGEYPPMPGGVGAYTQELARALRNLDVQVSVLTSERAADPTVVQTNGVRVLPVIRHWDLTIWRTLGNLSTALGADWIHVQYQTAAYAMYPAINFAPWWLKRKGHCVAWTYHDLLVPYLFPRAGRRLRSWVTTRPAHDAELTIVTNEGDRQRLAAAQIEAANIPIGSNIQGRLLSPAERRARRRQRNYGDDAIVLGYFGFLNRSKGGLTLIRALARLVAADPNVQLLMIGEQVGASDATNDDYWQDVQGLIRKLSLASHVQWTGQESDADVAADLNACDFLLMPYVDGASLRRGTLMAGLANGCAIVTTTPQAPIPELVEGRDLLYVPPEDEKRLAAAVRQLVMNPSLAAELRKNARTASALFHWDAIARAHLALYTRSCTGQGSDT